MARRARLQEFLGSRYPESDKLRAFVEDSFVEDASRSISWGQGLNEETSDLIRWLEAHDKIGELWPALRAAFPDLASEIDAVAAEWKPRPLDKLIPGILRRSRPLQIGLASAVVIGIAVVVLVSFLRASYTTVLVLDGAARDAIRDGASFAVDIDGTSYALTSSGLSIGKGDVLPRSVRDAYRAELPGTQFPASVRVRLTRSRAKTIRVTFRGASDSAPRRCPTQPPIIADGNTFHLITLDHCDPRTIVEASNERPKIGVRISISGSGDFLRLVQAGFGSTNPMPTVESFLSERLIKQLSKIGIFEFVPASDSIPPAMTLVGSIVNTEWPRRGDLVIRLKLGSEDEQPMVLVPSVSACNGALECRPPSFADELWYDEVFQRFVDQWPPGFLKSVVLTTTATYERGGVIRTDEGIEKFGQLDGGPPKALFDIAYGDNHRRTFVLCGATPTQPQKAVGHDVPPTAATCVNLPSTNEPTGRNGKVTLFRVLRVSR